MEGNNWEKKGAGWGRRIGKKFCVESWDKARESEQDVEDWRQRMVHGKVAIVERGADPQPHHQLHARTGDFRYTEI